MLDVLKIKNFAIIDETEVHFKSGLNILSGETGAGKSIVIEAISLLLGSRASCESIRKGSEEAVIEGLFNIAEIPWLSSRLEQAGYSCNTKELLIKRVVHRAGRHRIFINGELATLAILQMICEGLIDLCGQHEHQSLVKPVKQGELLDRFGEITDEVRSYSVIWNQVRSLEREIQTLSEEKTERIKKRDFLQFQIDEIRSVNPVLGEDEKLQEEKRLLQSAALRVQSADTVRQILESEDQGVLNCLQSGLQRLRNLAQLDNHVQPWIEAIERGRLEIEEVVLGLHQYLASIEVNPERLHEIQERLSFLANLKRKYGTTIPEILNTIVQLEGDLFQLEQTTDQLTKLESNLKNLKEELRKKGNKLSQSRKKISETLSKSVTSELKDLNMEEAIFSVAITPKGDLSEWSIHGPDLIQFLVQPNLGETGRPISKIASGGELSRLMLSIRRVIADRGGIGVYLFDEIDAGIGGQTAFQVGKKLKSVAQYNQVICITHLPQVASFADHHLVVRKSVYRKRTRTEVRELPSQEREEELARMLAGPRLTQKSIENASELLELARSQGSFSR